MEIFKIRDLKFRYPAGGEKNALDGISLDIERGSYTLLCGESGGGKTTLLRHLKTVLTPNGRREGEIYFNGTPLRDVPEKDQASMIGYVMQDPDDQIVTDKVWHELAFGLESLGCDQSVMRSRVAEMACYFGIQDWFHRDTSTLSGGQKQLLNLASIMAMQPEVLILDEPTSQLDPVAASDFLNTVKKINTELGTTVIVSEHRLEEIFPSADRVIVMSGGKVSADGAPREVGRLLHDRSDDMFASMPAPVRVFYGTGGACECPLTVRDGRAYLSEKFSRGDKVGAIPAPDARADGDGEPAVKLKEVWFRYEKDAPDVLRGVTAAIPVGCHFAIVGGNGGGKTTLLRSVCGICRPYRGKIEIFGKNIGKYKNRELFDGCAAMLPQDPKLLFVKKTVRDELAEMTKSDVEIERVTALCRLSPLMDRHPYDLSCGEQQRTALAKVLLTKPRLLLLDEPTKGMDSSFKEELARILSELKEGGVTVLTVSHDVEFCAKYADVVGMFFDGQILSVDTPRRFFGGNSFYTTAASRMSRHLFDNAVTVEDVTEFCSMNGSGSL